MKPTTSSVIFSALAVCSLLVSGCASVHTEAAGTTQTAVNLNQNNYRVIKAGAMGTSYGFKLLGILPFASASASRARANLYHDLKLDLQGKSVALANTTQDRTGIYLILFSVPKVTVQADVIEYVNATPGTAAPALSAQH